MRMRNISQPHSTHRVLCVSNKFRHEHHKWLEEYQANINPADTLFGEYLDQYFVWVSAVLRVLSSSTVFGNSETLMFFLINP
jgi:uncharacterized protein YegL